MPFHWLGSILAFASSCERKRDRIRARIMEYTATQCRSIIEIFSIIEQIGSRLLRYYFHFFLNCSDYSTSEILRCCFIFHQTISFAKSFLAIDVVSTIDRSQAEYLVTKIITKPCYIRVTAKEYSVLSACLA
jgi:hypothetical protein